MEKSNNFNRSFLVSSWGEETAQKVIDACSRVNFSGTLNDFLSHCTACGGNWTGMLLSGIKELFAEVWEALPDSLDFECLLCTLGLCGVHGS